MSVSTHIPARGPSSRRSAPMAAAGARPQHMDALDKANAVYSQMAHLRKSLKELSQAEALMLLADMLCAPDDCLDAPLGALRAGKALSAVRGIGAPRAERLLRDALGEWVPSSSKRVRDLTERQRRLLAAELRRRAAKPGRRAA